MCIRDRKDLLNSAISELCELMGLKQKSIHSLKSAISWNHKEINRDEEVKQLRMALATAQNAINLALETPAAKASK